MHRGGAPRHDALGSRSNRRDTSETLKGTRH
jgi:hypothetical protein